jgi:hypothetical protein
MKHLTNCLVFFAGLLLVLGMAYGQSWSINDPPVRSVTAGDAYCKAAKDEFNALYTYYRDDVAATGDINALYHLERMFDGMDGVYEVTGDVDVANKMLDIALKIVDAGKDRNGDGFLDYCFLDENGNPAPSDPGDPACDDDPNLMCTYPWKALRGPAKALRVAKSAGLDKTRPVDYAKLRTFMLHDVIDKWLDTDGPGPDTGQGGSHTAGIDSRMAGILLDTYYATGDPRIGEMAREWVLWVATDMEDVSGAYRFDNWIKENEEIGPADTSHANEIVALLIEGFEAGFLPYSFIEPLHATWLNVMWNKDANNPSFREYVDGTGAWQDATSVMGWMRLGQFMGQTQSVAGRVYYSSSYDYDYIQANANLCRIYSNALTTYPLAYPQTVSYLQSSESASTGVAVEVICSSSKCAVSSGKKCCTVSYGEYADQYCATTCPYTAIACDGPEDCGGNACCGFFGTGWGCSASRSCSATALQLCHASSDCSSDAPYCCANTGLPGLYHAVCSRFDCSGKNQASTTSTRAATTTTIAATTTIRSTSSTIKASTTTRASTTSTRPSCVMLGNTPPCNTVSLSKVVNAINDWAKGNMTLGAVISLINSWSDPSANPAS